MFENDLLERFSRIHPATPFIAWGPPMLWMLYRAWNRNALSGLGILGYAVAGYLVWTITEYVLHRFIFHMFEDNPKHARIHFLLHGVHHDYPTDKTRLVMPLLVSLPVGWAICAGMFLGFGPTVAEPAFAGFALGYMSYDGIHYYLHRFNQTTRVGKWMKHHHMRHHYMDHAGGFGVSTPIWDFVFRTMPVAKKPVPVKNAGRGAALKPVTEAQIKASSDAAAE